MKNKRKKVGMTFAMACAFALIASMSLVVFVTSKSLDEQNVAYAASDVDVLPLGWGNLSEGTFDTNQYQPASMTNWDASGGSNMFAKISTVNGGSIVSGTEYTLANSSFGKISISSATDYDFSGSGDGQYSYDSGSTMKSNVNKYTPMFYGFVELPKGTETGSVKIKLAIDADDNYDKIIVGIRFASGVTENNGSYQPNAYTDSLATYQYQYSAESGAVFTKDLAIPNGAKYLQINTISVTWPSTFENVQLYANSVKLTFDTEKSAPTMTEPTVSGNGYASKTISVSASDAETGLQKVTISANGLAETNMTDNGSGNFSFVATDNGTYTLKAYDNAGNITTKTIEVTGIDKISPAISAIVNTTEKVVGERTISFNVQDEASGIKTVTVDNGASILDNGNGKYSFVASKNGNYVVTMTDIAGNSSTETIVVSNVYDAKITLNGVEFVTTHDGFVNFGDSFTVKVIANFGDKITGLNVASTTLKNYGVYAEFEVNFVQNMQTDISAVISKISITPALDGIYAQYAQIKNELDQEISTFDFGSFVKFVANDNVAGKKFIGWKNANGVIVSTEPNYIMRAYGNFKLAPIFEDEIANSRLVTFLGIDGKSVFKRGYYDFSALIADGLTNEEVLSVVGSQTYDIVDLNRVFSHWNVEKNDETGIVLKAISAKGEIKKTVTFNGTPKEFTMNTTAILPETTYGWNINGKIVKTAPGEKLNVYVFEDMTITELVADEVETNGIVINGIYKQGLMTYVTVSVYGNFDSCGLIVSTTKNANDEVMLLNGNDGVMIRTSSRVSATKQFTMVFDSDTVMSGIKIRAYLQNGNGVDAIKYSDIKTAI